MSVKIHIDDNKPYFRKHAFATIFDREGLRVGVLLAITLLIYWPGLSGGYIFDDQANLLDAEAWKLTALDWRSLCAALFSNGSGVLGRSLAMLSFGLNHYTNGMEPFAYKLTNVFFHLLNGALVYLLVKRLLALDRFSTPPQYPPLSNNAAWVITAIWLLHPLQVSTVLYIVQRMELGACTGTLCALLCYLNARRCQILDRVAWPWWCLMGLSTAFGLGFKETALLVPGFTLVLELLYFNFRTGPTQRSSPLLIGIYVLGAVGIAIAFIGYVLPWAIQPETYATREFTIAQRLLTQLRVLPTYLGWTLFPFPQQYAFYYDNFEVSTGLMHPWTTFAGCLVLVTMAALAVVLRNSWRLFALGITWFFVAHSLTSTIIPLELVFEHRNYFSILAVLLAVAHPIAKICCRISLFGRKILLVGSLAFVAFLCSIETQIWASPAKQAIFFSSRNSESERANYELALLYVGMANGDKSTPYWVEAEQTFQRAANLPRAGILGLSGLIMMHADGPNDIPSKTWQELRSRIRKRSLNAEGVSALSQMVNCSLEKRCHFNNEELLNTLLIALEANPSSTNVLTIYANFAAGVLGDYDLAVRLMQAAVELSPASIQLQSNLGVFEALAGNKEDAARRLKWIKSKDYNQQYMKTWEKIEILLGQKQLQAPLE